LRRPGLDPAGLSRAVGVTVPAAADGVLSAV